MCTRTASILSVVLFNIEAAELTVRYYNEAKVSTKALAFAVETANRTLRQAGVKARWIDCYLDAAACKGDVESAVVELTIAADIQSEGVGNFAMGISLLPGVYAKVLWNRVTRYAKAFDVPVATVLGYVMAHEIGHLLMNTAAHAPEGVMKAVWTRTDTSLLAGGRMAFQGYEGAKMRRRLRGTR